MVVEYIRYEIEAEQKDAFLTAYREAGRELEQSPQCLRYDVSEGVEEPRHFVVRIEWTSVEAHERDFRSSARFRTFFEQVRPFVGAIREMKHYDVRLAGPSIVPN